MKQALPFLALLVASPAFAADDEQSHITVYEGETVTITEHHPKDMRERVEVDPVNGRPYVLLDSDNDGALDSNSSSPTRNDGLMMWSVGKW
jgi:hypothetical protein